MSVSQRSIGLYTFEFVNPNDGDRLEGEKLADYFNQLLDAIISKNFADKKLEISTSNKFYYLADSQGTNTKKIIFESAKTGHRPYLVDEETGAKRDNPKGLHEGEAEIAHLVTKTKKTEVVVALEKRLVGVTANQIQMYLNKFIHELPPEKRFFVEYYIVPFEGFIEHLNDFSRITVGSIYVDKAKIGSEHLRYSELDLQSVKDEVELTFKSHRGDSIKKDLVRNLYKKFDKQEIRRLRIEGKSQDNADIKLDTNSLAFLRKIDVKLLEDTGLVDSNDIFDHLTGIISEV